MRKGKKEKNMITETQITTERKIKYKTRYTE